MDVASCAEQGWRLAMEDVWEAADTPHGQLLAVFDGHGGARVAEVAKALLTPAVASMRDPFDQLEMENLFIAIDAYVLSTPAKEEGTTASVVLIKKRRFAIQDVQPEPGDEAEVPKRLETTNSGAESNERELCVVTLGDSFTVLFGGDGTIKFQSRSHDPAAESEVRRIRAAGGFVSNSFGPPRVNGFLAVSGAFGDAHLKRGGSGPRGHLVTCVPFIDHITAQAGDYLLLASDGLVDFSQKDHDIAKLVSRASELLQQDPDVHKVARQLVTEALTWSRDNCTCLLTRL